MNQAATRDREVRTVCPYCGVGCGVLATVRGRAVTAVRGDPGHPTNRGGLCSKGQRLVETLRTGDRLLHPLSRPTDPEGRFRRDLPWHRVRWGEALAECAERLRAVQRAHGADSIAFYLSGQLLTEDYYAANKLVKGFLGTNNVDTNSRLCMASAVAAYKLAFGSDAPPGCYEDGDTASCVILLGSNAAETHPIVFGRLLRARDRTRARWIVVDPRRTATARAADLHLPITPGTDVALLLAMLNVCIDERLVDARYVRAHTSGYEEAAAVARQWPADRAAAVCAVPADHIRSAARLFAGSAGTMSLWCQGLNQATTATDRNLALINLHLATGQLGRPGCGPFSLTGQANAMGGREVGGMATELAAHRTLADGAHRDEVRAFWGGGAISGKRGLTAVELVDALLDGRVRAVWIAGSNPVASLPDASRGEAALRRAEFVVVQELFHPTDTSILADILLPAAGWAEKTGTLTSSERRVALAQAVVDPPGEARPDWRIFADVASHLGHGDAFAWMNAADVFAEHAALTRGQTCDMSGLDHRRLREESVQWPCPTRDHPGQARRYEDGVFPTPDGRARFHPTPFVPPWETPSPDYPLRLTTVRTPDAWHTLTKSGKVASLRRRDPGPRVEVHPDDARAAGVEDGDLVEVVSRRGSWRGRARHSDAMRPGTVAVPFHCAPLWNRRGWINRLTPAAVDARSLQPELKHAAVRLVPADHDLDGVVIVGHRAAHRLAEALRRAGVHDVEVRDWTSPPPDPRPWVAVVDSTGHCRRWLALSGLAPPLTVDAAARICGRDGARAAGWRVHTLSGLPVTTSAEQLAAALLGDGLAGARTLVRSSLVTAGRGRRRFTAGAPDPIDTDDEQGIRSLRLHDTAAGLEVTWRMASGQALGVRAEGPAGAVARVASAWFEDRSPAEIQVVLASLAAEAGDV